MPSEASNALAAAIDRMVEERAKIHLESYAQLLDQRIKERADAYFEQLHRDTFKDGVLDVLHSKAGTMRVEAIVREAICSTSHLRMEIEDLAVRAMGERLHDELTKDDVEEIVREFIRDSEFTISLNTVGE